MKITGTQIYGRRLRARGTLAVCTIGALLFTHALTAAVYDVDLKSPRLTVYRDPITGNELKYGGFSGLFPVPGMPDGLMFYTITDRGPNGDNPTNANGKVFPRPDYSPTIIKVLLHPNGVNGGKANIVDILPLRKPTGAPVNGLPNPCLAASEIGYDLSLNLITSPAVGGDPDGLDVEGITMDEQGNFWICEEYQPSICKVAPDGTVLFRLVPKGAKLCGTEAIPTYDILPPMIFKRRPNRGFEGVAAQNGKIYAVLQRPLMNPSRATSDASRLIRLVEVDTATWTTRQLIYVTENTASQANVLLSDLFSLGGGRFLVPERRTDKLFSIDITGATDISGLEDSAGKLLTPFISGTNTFTTLEQLKSSDLPGLGVVPVAKTVVLSSMIALDPALEKIGGVAVVGGVLAMTADNDFNFVGIDDSTSPASIVLNETPNLSKIITIPVQ